MDKYNLLEIGLEEYSKYLDVEIGSKYADKIKNCSFRDLYNRGYGGEDKIKYLPFSRARDILVQLENTYFFSEMG